MKKMLISPMVASCLFWSASAFAVPALQLDISDGIYDSGTETVVSTSNLFTLYALLDPAQSDSTGTFYISAAVLPAWASGPQVQKISAATSHCAPWGESVFLPDRNHAPHPAPLSIPPPAGLRDLARPHSRPDPGHHPVKKGQIPGTLSAAPAT